MVGFGAVNPMPGRIESGSDGKHVERSVTFLNRLWTATDYFVTL